jgi:ferric-dicitrate binding protein FerR (iron transport regulator)
VVTGTHFNINAYADEPNIKATLLEGSVNVSKADVKAALKPGQQAQVPFGTVAAEIPVMAVDVEEATAWKNGLFRFNNADLPTVMRQLSRWYDVEVHYEGNVPPRKFEGEIQRGVPLSDVMEALGKSQVHFRIEGKKIVLIP